MIQQEVSRLTKLLAIYDTEASYAARLMDYMKRATVADFEILMFTRRESLEEFLKDHVVELLLLGEEMQEELPRENIRFTVRLSGSKAIGRKEAIQTIYKYQSAREVLNDLLACYMKAQGSQSSVRDRALSLISVFAPVGGLQEGTYARNLALCLAEKQKVLLLQMEQLPVSEEIDLTEKKQALSEFIYYLKEEHTQFIPKLKEQLMFSGKLAYLSGIAHGLDLLSLGKEDAVRLIEELRKSTDFEAVIFYLGIYTEFAIEVMKHSDYNHILANESSYSRGVLREWDRQMEFIKVDTKAEHYKRLLLPESTNGEGAANDRRKEVKNSAIWQLAKQQVDLLC